MFISLLVTKAHAVRNSPFGKHRFYPSIFYRALTTSLVACEVSLFIPFIRSSLFLVLGRFNPDILAHFLVIAYPHDGFALLLKRWFTDKLYLFNYQRSGKGNNSLHLPSKSRLFGRVIFQTFCKIINIFLFAA